MEDGTRLFLGKAANLKNVTMIVKQETFCILKLMGRWWECRLWVIDPIDITSSLIFSTLAIAIVSDSLPVLPSLSTFFQWPQITGVQPTWLEISGCNLLNIVTITCPTKA